MLKIIKEHNNRSKLTISVYYEAQCPDSRSFFVRHLLPVFLEMGSALDIELIPYGHAETFEKEKGRFTFKCQHGPGECFGNKLHACAILNIEDLTLRLQYVTCLIDDFDDLEETGFQCARKYDIPWKLILNCATGVQGDWLLKNYGELTNKLKQPISFVPTILLNQNFHKQSLILKNLKKELCLNYQSILTKECEK